MSRNNEQRQQGRVPLVTALPPLPGPRRGRDMAVAMGAMLLAVVLMTLFQSVDLRRRFLHEMHTQARIVGQNTAAALVSNVPADAHDVLKTFGAAPEIHSAVLLRADGSVMSQYTSRPDDWATELGGLLTVSEPVEAGGRTVGRLVVQARRTTVIAQLARFVGGSLTVALTALGLFWAATRRLRATADAAEERSRHLARHDALTDLPNRACLHQVLGEVLARPDRPAALMLIDIDDFTRINSVQGPAGGDDVLREVGGRLRVMVRPGDVVARVGGDEYAVLLGLPDDRPDTVETLAQSVMSRLRAAMQAGNERPAISASAGVVILPRDAATADDALQCAGAALRNAKDEGKDSFRLFSPAMREAMSLRLALEADVREALREQHFLLHYQPIFDAAGRMASLEGLIRWQHPTQGLVPPGRFIPMAEATGLIVDLGIAALHRLRQDVDHARAHGAAWPMTALNLSANQFRRAEHRQRFLAALDLLSLGPDVVEFELTETTVFEDLHSPASILRQLRDRGYTVAIDDFGTGYSSLSYLRQLRARKLKIDQSFVRDLEVSDEARLLVQTMVNVGHALNMVVVAEGVETPAQRQTLLEDGCDLLQGYLLARPQPPAQVLELLGAAATV